MILYIRICIDIYVHIYRETALGFWNSICASEPALRPCGRHNIFGYRSFCQLIARSIPLDSGGIGSKAFNDLPWFHSSRDSYKDTYIYSPANTIKHEGIRSLTC